MLHQGISCGCFYLLMMLIALLLFGLSFHLLGNISAQFCHPLHGQFWHWCATEWLSEGSAGVTHWHLLFTLNELFLRVLLSFTEFCTWPIVLSSALFKSTVTVGHSKKLLCCLHSILIMYYTHWIQYSDTQQQPKKSKCRTPDKMKNLSKSWWKKYCCFV